MLYFAMSQSKTVVLNKTWHKVCLGLLTFVVICAVSAFQAQAGISGFEEQPSATQENTQGGIRFESTPLNSTAEPLFQQPEPTPKNQTKSAQPPVSSPTGVRGINTPTPTINTKNNPKNNWQPPVFPKDEEENYPNGEVLVFVDIDGFSAYMAAGLKNLWTVPGIKKTAYIPRRKFEDYMTLLDKGFEQIGSEVELTADPKPSMFKKYKVTRYPTIIYINPEGKEEKFGDFATLMNRVAR